MNTIGDAFWKRSQSREFSDDWEKQREAARSTGQLHADYKHLEHQVDKLLLITRALWEMLAETRGIDDKELLSKVKEIDLRDGQLDGKLAQEAKDCRECGHKLSPRNHQCIYCGALVESDDVFAR